MTQKNNLEGIAKNPSRKIEHRDLTAGERELIDSGILSLKDIQDLRDKRLTIEEFEENGGNRRVYKASYPFDDGSETRAVAVKIPYANLDSVNIEVLSERGSLRKDAPIQKHLDHSAFLKVIESIELGDGRTIHVEEYRPGYVKMNRFLEDCNPSDKLFYQIFLKLLPGIKFASEIDGRGVVLGDIKPNNIIIKSDNKGTDAKFTDFQTSRWSDEITSKIFPTHGAAAYAHPRLLNLKDDNFKAGSNTDLYSLGATMFYALTKKNPFNYKLVRDKDGIDINGVKCSLRVDEESALEIDIRGHEQRLRNILKEVKSRYRGMLYKLMTADTKKSYGSIEEVIKDFNKITKKYQTPTKGEWIRKHPKLSVLMLSGLLGFGALSYQFVNKGYKAIKTFISESKKYPVDASYDNGIKIENNLVSAVLSVHRYDGDNKLKTGIQIVNSNDELGYIQAFPGDKLSATIQLTELAMGEDKVYISPELDGRVYIEGYEATNFSLEPSSHDGREFEDTPIGGGYKDVNMNIPKDIKKGIYNIIIEVYAPEKGKVNSSRFGDNPEKQVKFNAPNKVISKESVKLIVGDVDRSKLFQYNKIKVTGIGPAYVVVSKVYKDEEDRLKPGYDIKIASIEASIPEIGFKDNLSGSSYLVHLPVLETCQNNATLEIVARDNEGNIVNYHTVPVKTIYWCKPNKDDPKGFLEWEMALPDKEFYKKSIELRKRLEREDNKGTRR